ncbi:hypothetical protein IMSHALPRED_002866 [Imshaugia aleurites]|uniref:Uncharacterized protein n=1 Tax=Imshaugia aleurites TaxID=172621 RepID=A0A8H3J6U1_9LECA|nr:hypothetical protein IMSHALPRED_002866 [Imshaugia aleurites]
MAMEPLRRRKPAQTHPHPQIYYQNSENTRIKKRQPIASHSISISSSLPFSIARYCVRIAARSGFKAVFSPSAKPADEVHRTDGRPIHSVWYGHSTTTPDETLPPSEFYDTRPVHDTGVEQWVGKAAVVNITPLVPCDSRGRDMDSRRRSLKESPVTVVQREEDLDWRERADGEEGSGE